jgi:hypothetical protein
MALFLREAVIRPFTMSRSVQIEGTGGWERRIDCGTPMAAARKCPRRFILLRHVSGDSVAVLSSPAVGEQANQGAPARSLKPC